MFIQDISHSKSECLQLSLDSLIGIISTAILYYIEKAANVMVGDKTTLPYEVTYSEKPSMDSKNMKRLADLLKPQNIDDVTSLLKEIDLRQQFMMVKGVGKEKE